MGDLGCTRGMPRCGGSIRHRRCAAKPGPSHSDPTRTRKNILMSTIHPIGSAATDVATAAPMNEDAKAAALRALTVDIGSILNVTNVLFAVQNNQQDSQQSEQETAIRAEATSIRLAMDRVREAAEQARENADKSSFWGDVAS